MLVGADDGVVYSKLVHEQSGASCDDVSEAQNDTEYETVNCYNLAQRQAKGNSEKS